MVRSFDRSFLTSFLPSFVRSFVRLTRFFVELQASLNKKKRSIVLSSGWGRASWLNKVLPSFCQIAYSLLSCTSLKSEVPQDHWYRRGAVGPSTALRAPAQCGAARNPRRVGVEILGGHVPVWFLPGALLTVPYLSA